MQNNIIQNNTCNGTDWAVGGGMKITTNGYALISNNKIIDNTISAGIEATGGGIEIWGPIGSDIYIISNLIKGNTVQANNGGGGGLDIYECTTNTPVIENNVIVDNYSSAFGGGVYVDLDLDDSFKSGLIESNNTTEYGDALADQPGRGAGRPPPRRGRDFLGRALQRLPRCDYVGGRHRDDSRRRALSEPQSSRQSWGRPAPRA